MKIDVLGREVISGPCGQLVVARGEADRRPAALRVCTMHGTCATGDGLVASRDVAALAAFVQAVDPSDRFSRAGRKRRRRLGRLPSALGYDRRLRHVVPREFRRTWSPKWVPQDPLDSYALRARLRAMATVERRRGELVVRFDGVEVGVTPAGYPHDVRVTFAERCSQMSGITTRPVAAALIEALDAWIFLGSPGGSSFVAGLAQTAVRGRYVDPGLVYAKVVDLLAPGLFDEVAPDQGAGVLDAAVRLARHAGAGGDDDLVGLVTEVLGTPQRVFGTRALLWSNAKGWLEVLLIWKGQALATVGVTSVNGLAASEVVLTGGSAVASAGLLRLAAAGAGRDVRDPVAAASAAACHGLREALGGDAESSFLQTTRHLVPAQEHLSTLDLLARWREVELWLGG
jgi:hypothetical protein